MGEQKPSAQVLDVPTAPAAKAPVYCNAEPLGSQGVGECELEPREGCFWPSATPGLLAKSLLAAQALPATSAAAFLLVDIRGSSAPRKESWGSELGQEADLPEISQGLGLLSLPHSQSLGLFLPDAIPLWVMSTPLDGYPPRSPSCLSSLG